MPADQTVLPGPKTGLDAQGSQCHILPHCPVPGHYGSSGRRSRDQQVLDTCSRTGVEQCGRAGGPHPAQPLPAARGTAGLPQAGTGLWSQTEIVSLPLQRPAIVLLQPPCQAWQESPQADTSLNKGLAGAWLCVPVCDSSAVPPQPPVPLAWALSPAPTQGAWHARRSRAGQQAPPDPQGAGWTATYPLCWGVQAGARGAYVTGFVTSPGRGFGGEPAPKGRAVLLRAVLGAKLYFRGSEQGSES